MLAIRFWGQFTSLQALDRKEAVNAAESNEQKRETEKAAVKKQDKRNIYLLREGIIMNNSTAYTLMSGQDQTLRRNLEQESQAKTKNPNLAVSR